MVKQVDMDEKGIITAFEDAACLFNYQYKIELVIRQVVWLADDFFSEYHKKEVGNRYCKKVL